MPRQLRRLSDMQPDPWSAEWRGYCEERRLGLEAAFHPAEQPEMGWLVEGFLPIGYLAGKPKDGK